MGTRSENSVVVVVAGSPTFGEPDTLRSALCDAVDSTRSPDVFHLRHATEWHSWIGETPAAFGQRNTALAFSVAAYRRAADQATANQRPVGASILTDIVTQTVMVAVHTRSHAEIHELAPPRSLAKRDSAIAEIIRDAVMRSNSVQHAGQRTQPIAVEHAPQPLADVWHGKRPAVWSVRGTDWKTEAEVAPAGVLSGSFHPLHVGHQQLRNVAEQFLGGSVHFELPIANADKPSLDYVSIGERCRQFTESTLAVTNAPTFVEKVAFYSGVTFIVGADTAERIVDPRFYGGDRQSMERGLSAIGSAKCRFLVAGRQLSAGFQTIHDIALPSKFLDLFVELPESHFRMDVSSTQTRQRGR